MNEGFTTRMLGDVCDEVKGIIRTGPFGSQLHESDYCEEGTPVVMPKNIIDGQISVEDIARIGDEDLERLSQHKLCEGDIVYGRRGDIGRRALITKRETGWLCGTGCLRISLGTEVFDPTYLYYYLGHPKITAWIYNQAIGATLPNLNTSVIRNISVAYFPLSTQRKIASILSAYDDLIENNTRRIHILEAMAQMLYREWFVHFRFPGHEQVRMVSSEMGEIPEGWKIGKINEFLSIKSGFAFKSTTFDKEGFYGLVTIKNVQDGYFVTECQNRVQNLPVNMPTYCYLKTGEILFSLTGNIGRVCFIYGDNYLLNQRVAKLVPNEIKNRAYVYLMFRQRELQEKLERIATGVAQQNLSPVETSKMEMIFPKPELLKKFSEIFEPFVDQIIALFCKNANLRKTRDLLLPKLISGEIDVEDLDIDIGSENNDT